MLIMLRVMLGAFTSVYGLLTLWPWQSNVTIIGWRPLMFLLLSSAALANELVLKQLWLMVSVFSKITVVAPRTTSIAYKCGFSISNSYLRP